MKTDALPSATVEEYLETIYNMTMEDETVIGARLAERFNVSPPTVTEMLKRLVKQGYIEMNNKRHVTLTEAGIQAAEGVLRRHRLTERFLVDMLGMQWHEVHEEACRLEHFISGAVEARVIASLNHPTTCPHGNPIPGMVPNARNYLKDHHAVRLSTIPPGSTAKIFCISEVVEDEEALIFYLHQKGLTPGTQLLVVEQQSISAEDSFESVKLQVESHEVCIDMASSAKIWVTS
ncbi:MAG TPA: metal-dependent transcriptional regulator [Ktedonobacteraceae bacterium]|nr:metal-dependent transcriptional regulator [Ktedonobacteraceae bacterium]